VYVPGVDDARSITPVDALIFNPAGDALKVPPVAPVVINVVEPVVQNVPPLTVAVGFEFTVTELVVTPVQGAVPYEYVIIYVPGVDAARLIVPVVAEILNPAGDAEKVPPVVPVIFIVVVPVAQNVPPLIVADGCAFTITVLVVVPLHGAVPNAYVIVYVFGVDDARSITPVDAFIFNPAGDALKVPPVAPVVVKVVVPVVQNVPPLTVAVGLEFMVTVFVAVPVQGAVP